MTVRANHICTFLVSMLCFCGGIYNAAERNIWNLYTLVMLSKCRMKEFGRCCIAERDLRKNSADVPNIILKSMAEALKPADVVALAKKVLYFALWFPYFKLNAPFKQYFSFKEYHPISFGILPQVN